MEHEPRCSFSALQSSKRNWCWSLVPDQADLWAELELPSLDESSLPFCRHLQSHVAFIVCVLPRSWCKMNNTHERRSLHL